VKGGKYERMRKFKNWLLHTFCMNELMDFQDYYLGNIRKIENEANRKNQDIDIVHRILSEKNNVIVGEADNKNGEHVFIVQHVNGNSIEFMLYSNRYKAINNHPRIMATYNDFFDNNSYVKIDDIIVEDNDVGNGSILMPFFIDYCKRFTEAKRITGWLSSVDSGHFDRSTYFYKKHGFEVELNTDDNTGSIEYRLREVDVQ